MDKVMFSVCIPVYNTDMYLKECIDSVVNQTYKNFEIILVDDGSTDSSGIICDEYKEKYENVTVYHNENRGMLYSRKYACERAKGNYCVFIDADDYIEPDTLKKLFDIISREDCDMVVYNYRRFSEKGTEDVDILWNEYRVFETGKEKEEYYKEFLFSSKLNTLWRKSIKTSLLLDDSYDHEKNIRIRNGEDFALSLYPTFNANKIVYTPEVFYNYRFNPDGVSCTFNPKKFESIAEVRAKGLLYLKKSSLNSIENIDRYREYCLKLLLDLVKEISLSNNNCKEKERLFNELKNNNFFKEFVIKNENKNRNKKLYNFFMTNKYKIVIRETVIKYKLMKIYNIVKKGL